jgi:F0F1-type ATP synthase assembly protein I
MRLLFTRARNERATGADDNLGRGMEAALILGVFLGLGWLIDTWLGTRPVFMIGLVLFAAIGTFVRMKYTYDAKMVALEEERRQLSRQGRAA